MSENTAANDAQSQLDAFVAEYQRLAEEIGKVIVAQRDVVDEVLTTLFAGGHALLEGVPGLGKTLLVRTLADATRLEFQRIQFTPDLMPADITGTNILSESAGGREFRFQPGPIFANLVLADEINRATPKTQSALLEAMQDRSVSTARTTHPLPAPFLVLATQNPIEMEGTYPLPEAQLDRFLLKIRIDPLTADELSTVLDRTTTNQAPAAEPVLDAARVEEIKHFVRSVPAATHVREYVARLVTATRSDQPDAPPMVRRYVRYGASPRGAQAVLLAAKVAALRAGRANVAFADVRAAVPAALRHRLVLNFQGQADAADPDAILAELLADIPAT